MKISLSRVGIAALAFTSVSANAAGLLGNYTAAGSWKIDTQEASAVAFNWDTRTLMVTNDEEHGDLAYFGEYNLDGSKVASYTVPGCQSFSKSKCDPEGLTYIGNGKYVVGEERPRSIAVLEKTSATTLTSFADADTIKVYNDGKFDNSGLEGVAFERSTGDFFAVKETSPQLIWQISGADFGAGTATVTNPFNIASLGLATLSDIAVLSNSGLGDNLLILSGTSQVIYEVTRAGALVSQFDLSGYDSLIDPTGAGGKFEGLTIDDKGNIYLVSDDGDGPNQSYLVKLQYNAPSVPEPATWAMMVAGFGLVGVAARRRSRAAIA